jgi:hypothetical protein
VGANEAQIILPPFSRSPLTPSCGSIHNTLHALITSVAQFSPASKLQTRFEPRLFPRNMAAEHHSVCEGWPTALNSTLVWDHEQFPNEDAYIHILSADEKTEINDALKTFKGLSLCD